MRIHAQALALAILALLALAAPADAGKPTEPDQSPYQGALDKARDYWTTHIDPDSEEDPDPQVLYVLGNMANTLFHEFGHAMISELELPVLGKEEDAVDAFANVIMVSKDADPVLDGMIVAVADDYFTAGQYTDYDPPAWDEHSMNEQRAYAVVCMLVGSDAEGFKEIADNAEMPEERQQACAEEFNKAVNGWDNLLQDHYLEDGERQTARISIKYGRPLPDQRDIAGLIKASGIVEDVAASLTSMIKIPNNITVSVESCEEENAYWSPDERKMTFCYELAQYYLNNALEEPE
jgi:hypothetical protein